MNRYVILVCLLFGLTLAAKADPVAPSDPASLVTAERYYRHNCAMCHGLDGRGDKDVWISIKPTPRNFVTEDFKFGGSDQQIFDSITKGSPGTGMYSFSRLPEERRWQLVGYVKFLRSQKQLPTTEKICPRCHAENAANAKYCNQCATPLK